MSDPFLFDTVARFHAEKNKDMKKVLMNDSMRTSISTF